jgi:hypothetical protein
VGILDQTLNLGVDLLGDLDLLGDRLAQLVDPVQGFGLIDQYPFGQKDLPAVGDERLEPLDVVDDVDRTGPPGAARGGCRIGGL